MDETIRNQIQDVLESAKDPYNIYNANTLKQSIDKLNNELVQPNVVGIIDAGGGGDLKTNGRKKIDAILNNF